MKKKAIRKCKKWNGSIYTFPSGEKGKRLQILMPISELFFFDAFCSKINKSNNFVARKLILKFLAENNALPDLTRKIVLPEDKIKNKNKVCQPEFNF